MKIVVITLFIITLLWHPNYAVSDFDAGIKAYQAKKYDVALREFQTLAEKGDPKAQTNLGVLYRDGKGPPEL